MTSVIQQSSTLFYCVVCDERFITSKCSRTYYWNILLERVFLGGGVDTAPRIARQYVYGEVAAKKGQNTLVPLRTNFF